MIKFNILILAISSLIPSIVGVFYFNPKVKEWMQLEKTSAPFSIFIFSTSIILSFLYSVALSYQVVHQLHFQSIFYNEIGFLNHEGSAFKDFQYILDKYGNCFRTFKHGAFHGLLNSVFIVLPILGLQGILERKSWKHIMYIWGFSALCGMIMGGIICEFY